MNHFRPEMVEVAEKDAEEQRVDARVRWIRDLRGEIFRGRKNPDGQDAKSEADDRDDVSERADLLAHRQAVRRARIRRVATGAAGLAALVVLWQVGAMILGDQVALP